MCGKTATTDVEAHEWRAYLTAPRENDSEGESEGVVLYCPECTEREFGKDDPER